jgi:hypothetical protein
LIDNIGSRLIELEDALFILDKLIPTNSKLLWRPPAALLESLKSPAAILDNKPLEMHVRAWDSADDASAVQVEVFDACHMRRRIHACHMRRRIHACHMRRRIHACHTYEDEEEEACL